MNLKISLTLLIAVGITILPLLVDGDRSNGHLSIPNLSTSKSMENKFGLGIIHPYPYYQKPSYRYPVYDEKGRGQLVYGYGGKETYQYKEFTPIEGHY